MDNDTKSMPVCKNCGKPVKKGQLYCSQCMIELAEKNIPEEEEKPKLKQPKENRFMAVVQWIVFLICIIVIALQMPSLFAAFEENRPIRQGTYSTDAQTDQCIRNLWRISKRIQEGKSPGTDIVCPASKKPYVVIDTGEDILVRCPIPEFHGFSEIVVSKKNPIPEAKK